MVGLISVCTSPSSAGPNANPYWVSRGLVSLYNLTTNSWNRNVVTGEVGGVSLGSGVTFPRGRLRTPNAAGSGASLAHKLRLNVNDPITIVIGKYFIAGNTAWSLLDTSIPEWTGWTSYGANGVQSVLANTFSSGVSTSDSPVAFRHSGVETLRGSALLSRPRLIRVDATSVFPQVKSPNIVLGFSRRSVDDNPSSTEFTHFAAFQGALTDGEIAELAINPWQMFAPQGRRIYVPVSGGGATTHATSGAVAGQGATIAGSATNFTPHATSGTISGQGAAIAGSASNFTPHSTSGAISGQGSTVAGSAAHIATHATSGAIAGPGAEVSGAAQNGTSTGAGKRHKPILIDARGQIHEFATQEGANAFLKSLEPIEEKQIQAKAKRIVSAVVRTGSAFKPTELTPVKVISGPPELTALANMRAAILQGQLNALVNAQIQAEMQRQEDDELAAVAVMMMME